MAHQKGTKRLSGRSCRTIRITVDAFWIPVRYNEREMPCLELYDCQKHVHVFFVQRHCKRGKQLTSMAASGVNAGIPQCETDVSAARPSL
jgi:hypothetical protein